MHVVLIKNAVLIKANTVHRNSFLITELNKYECVLY